MEQYIVRLADQSESQPLSFDELKKLIENGSLKATSMIYTESSQKWRLAASVKEVRNLIREYLPDEDSALNRLRPEGVAGSTIRMLRKRRAHERSAKPFWKKILFWVK